MVSQGAYFIVRVVLGFTVALLRCMLRSVGSSMAGMVTYYAKILININRDCLEMSKTYASSFSRTLTFAFACSFSLLNLVSNL